MGWRLHPELTGHMTPGPPGAEKVFICLDATRNLISPPPEHVGVLKSPFLRNVGDLLLKGNVSIKTRPNSSFH